MKRYYLAYGSNLNVAQMERRCPDARIVGTAIIPNYELLFKGSMTGSYLTIEKRKNGVVPVAVWEVSPSDEEALDRYEGFPTFYYKKDFKIDLDGEALDAFAYIMHEDRPRGVPTEYYVRTCLDGYRTFRFDEKYIYRAVSRSRR